MSTSSNTDTKKLRPSTTKHKQNRKPTIKQQKAVANLLENGGNVSKAMKDAGYSAAMAKNPQKLTESPTIIHLMDAMGVTDAMMVDTLRNGLKAVDKDELPDHTNRHKYLETAIKLKGYGKQVVEGGIHFHQHTGEKKEDYGF
jgi:hypothetical protein